MARGPGEPHNGPDAPFASAVFRSQLVDKVSNSMEALKAGVPEAGLDDSAWKSTVFLEPPPRPNSICWLRRKITLPSGLAAMPTFVSLARPNDVHIVYLNGMIHPLLQSPVKGVIWYQGEQNLGNADAYAKMFPAMIQDWRAHYQQPAMPFYFVQLANLGTPSDLPANDHWPLMHEAQANALTLANTGMGTDFDIDDARDIHPKNKQDVGHRLALQTLWSRKSRG